MAKAVGIEIPLAAWGVIVPLVSLSGFLPISISGFGGTQAVQVLLLATFGVSIPQAFAMSALYALLVLAYNVGLGSLAWLIRPGALGRTPSTAWPPALGDEREARR